MFSPSRDQARQFFIDAWQRYRGREVLSRLEDIAVDLILSHPEYQRLLEDAQALSREYTPESGAANPFLHLALHLAIEEQIAIDQPAGIRRAFDDLAARRDDRHDALHVVLECLGETIWQAQRAGAPLDGAVYLECIRTKTR